MSSSSKFSWINLGLFVGSLLTCLIVLEIGFPHVARYVRPGAGDIYMPREFRIISQNSKADFLPHDPYVALLGDSYAAGSGDWRLSDSHGTPANILQERLGVDVVSFGVPAAGTLEGLALYPIQASKAIRSRYTLTQPTQMVYFFFEGNDFHDDERAVARYPALSGLNASSTVEEFEHALETMLSTPPTLTDYIQRHTISLQYITTALYGLTFYQPLPTEPASNTLEFASTTLAVPQRLLGPMSQLNDNSIHMGLTAFAAALQANRLYFASSSLLVVYVPSPASVYHYREPLAVLPSSTTTEAEAYARSNFIAHEVEKRTIAAGVPFVDLRPALRAAAQHGPIHGPGDWGHFNQRGYTIMANAVITFLSNHPFISDGQD